MGVVGSSKRMQSINLHTPTLALPLKGGGDLFFMARTSADYIEKATL
jgi:hypothetical protein